MKNAITMLKQIQTLLGVEGEEVQEVQLAQMTLENGTVLEADEFAPDNEVFIVTEEERIALPVGDYTLEDGRLLICAEEGIIAEIKEGSGEDMPEGEEPAEELAEEDMPEEKQEMEYATKEELSSAIEEMKAMIDEIKAMMNPQEEMSEEIPAEVKEELSAPATTPIKHSPEGKQSKEVQGFKFGANRGASVHDRVNQVLNQFKK
jgi:hypothetical protein